MNIKDTFKSTKNLFWGISVLLLILMAVMSQSSGSSGDEYVNYDHSEFVYNYYKTFGQDTTALNTPKTKLKYYGQAFDNMTYVINRWFNIGNYYESRHLLNSISGWLLILFTGLAASLVFGWQAGILTLLLMFFSPLILGHSWNNPKDIPFAFTYTFTLYFLIRFLIELPKRKVSTLIFLGFGIAASISIRIGGLILIPYIFLFTGLHYITKKSFYTKMGFNHAFKTILILTGVSIIGYGGGLLLWPYALEGPLKNPIDSLQQMTNFEVGLNQLFEGEIQLSQNISWYYGIKYIFIKSPLIITVGAFLFIALAVFRKDLKHKYIFFSLLLFAFIFPIAYTIYKDSNLYGGCRHLLWTYSPIVILAAGGFDFFLKKENKYIKYGTIAVIAILLFHPVKHTFKNHPLQYVYYNQLVGGTKGAYGNYEMDYYYHSLRDGADWLIDNELGDDSIIIATNHSRITEYYFRNYPQVKVIYSRFYEKGKEDWDYAIWANTHITPLQLEKGYWPPKKTIYTMDVDGVPVGAVVKRISDEDLKGFEALKKNKRTEAKNHFKNFLEIYPENEEVLEGYARIMLQERKLDSTLIYADSSIIYNPRQIGAWLLKTSALNTQKKYSEALSASNEMLEIKDDFAEGQFQKGFALKNLNKPNEALKAFQKATAYKKEYYQAMIQMGEILMNYKNYKKAIPIYDQILKYKENDLYATVCKAKCNHLQKDNIEAEKLLNTISERNQRNFEVVKAKCRIAMGKNDMNSAGTYLNMARNINNNAELFVLRGMYVMRQNRADLAKQYFEKAKELDPTNREAQDLLKSIQTKSTTVAASQNTTSEPKQQQSIMFQKPKPKKTSPITIPAK
ncbi:phospholipid carrier-dependent glycosyltransferase [Prolixibacteraceae bacterium Z1-6]|uniref:Phospholipid carrier-dependent glycosyltransferase n=1 Tax=Draconibacterium aestuarii TaxID=2998507 RepID=A0A9X3J5W4_9BACT|nr:phospholipid carrier-dependent glycosyltransferase [Prolixibacteraceae bacterium Z1-6]